MTKFVCSNVCLVDTLLQCSAYEGWEHTGGFFDYNQIGGKCLVQGTVVTRDVQMFSLFLFGRLAR